MASTTSSTSESVRLSRGAEDCGSQSMEPSRFELVRLLRDPDDGRLSNENLLLVALVEE